MTDQRTQYSLEYFRSYGDFLSEQRLQAKDDDEHVLRIIERDLKHDRDVVGLLRKVEQRHRIPIEIRLCVSDVGHRPNYANAGRRGSAKHLVMYGWDWVGELMHGDRRGYPNEAFRAFLAELRESYEDDWSRAADDYLGTLQPQPIRASEVYEELLPDAEKHRFKSALTNYMRGRGTLRWGLPPLIVRRHEEAVYLPNKHAADIGFLGELLLQGSSMLTSIVAGRISEALGQVGRHERILDKLV